MKKVIVVLLLFVTVVKLFAAEPGTDWWAQAGQGAQWTVNTTTNKLGFDGTIITGSRIATQFGIGAPYTGLNLKFDATVSATGESFAVVLGSDNGWGAGGSGIIIEINKYQIQALKNFDYAPANVVRLSSDLTTYQALFSTVSNPYSFVIDVNATGLITVTINGYVCPTTYQADVSVLAKSFALFSPGVSGFRLRNVVASKGTVTKKYFGTPFSGSYYIDAINGNDLSSGYSEVEAWKTFVNVNSNILTAGTKILLKKGCVWNQRLEIRGAGTSTNWISVAAYGTDPAKPKISLTNDVNDIGLLICDLDKTSGTARQQSISYIEVKDLEISNTRLGIYYRTITGTTNTGFRVSNVTFNNINCDPVMTAINSATDKNAEITNQLAVVKGNLETMTGASDGGVHEYIFPSAIFIGGSTFGNQRVSGSHTTVLTEFEVNNCQFNEAISGVMSVFYWPFISGMGADAWRQIVNKVKLTNITSTGIVNGCVGFDGVNGGAVADVNGVMQPDANGWGLIRNVNVTMGSAVAGRTWPNGTTGLIFSNVQNFLVDSCEFSDILNQGNPDGCGFDFETNNNQITIQNSKFLNNDGHSILMMNGGSFGGNTNTVIQKNLFAKNVKLGVSKFELYLNATSDNGGTHANLKIKNNMVFMRKKNINNQSIGFYDTTNRSYITATNNDLYYLEPTASPITVSFLGAPYTYNAQVSSVAAPQISSLLLNNGASTTSSRTIRIRNECSTTFGTPAYYMVSESATFAGVSWITYNTNFDFVLSTGNTAKIVYLKVKNSMGESPSYSTVITLNEVTTLVNVFNLNNLQLSIYPNPVSNIARVEILNTASSNLNLTQKNNYQVSLFSLTGTLLEQTLHSANSFNLDLSNYPAGTYIVKIIGNKDVFTKMVVKQ